MDKSLTVFILAVVPLAIFSPVACSKRGSIDGRAMLGGGGGNTPIPSGTGGAEGGSTGDAGSGGSGGGSGSGSGTGGSGGMVPCNDHQGFIKITGELPGGFGRDKTLSSGCSEPTIGSYSRPVSFTDRSGDSNGTRVNLLACSADGSLKVVLTFNFAPNGTGLVDGGLNYYVDGALRGVQVTALNETQKPVSDWAQVRAGSDEGAGKLYEGSFTAEGAPTGTPISVTGAFSVCHVANRPL